ncbi:uncharacterized protein LACBIDRAFT_302146 [Laccaria bicolor S238N-H82]|uniref:Predicted protein n=1 Tax=Laccaria bicolor (strain S238N-H82 / ATCC MYA-4686) TaxID=486041 RepID=B0DH59_LACBS|nr:uncharacterized protein LACBIDRAFT_302146 [Laccaria bicolor S238N-H82]EDR05958.1 predicted protein [Laccaria bicolor S238N-H82]|eukprot:XP_001883246.1 predicted protein [Laccaria bicolor S238N-H82]
MRCALHGSDVGVVDWHKKLVAVLNTENGSIPWRYIFDPEGRIAGFYKRKDCVAVLSSPGGATLRTYNALHGHLIAEKQLHAPQLPVLSEPRYLGKLVAFKVKGYLCPCQRLYGSRH